MITGAHSIIYSTDSEADRAFFQNVLKLPSVDVGGGWLIFGLPPSEVAMHPADKNGLHELYLICSDVEAFMTEMDRRGIACDPVVEQDWGLLTYVTLPGGSKLGVYEARHARPETPSRRQPAAIEPAAKPAAKRKAKRAANASAKKPPKRAAAKKPPKRAAAKKPAKSKKAGKGKKR
jgi:hypothetical protein